MHQAAVLSDSVLNRWTALLASRTGVCVTPAWEGHVRRVLSHRLMQPVAAGSDGVRAWWRELLDQLLIRETAFFRHRPSFDYLAEQLRDLSVTAEPITLWSAGCASGEEAYSMAATAARILPTSRFRIVATDLSAAALTKAGAAVYAAEQLDGLTADERACFAPAGDERVRVSAALRRRVACVPLNLMARRWPAALRQVDAIFCQHVLVYFGAEQRMKLLARFARCLKPGGRLVLGPGEYLGSSPDGLRRDHNRDVLAFVRTTGAGGR